MQELSSQPPLRAELSFQDRLYIIQTMNGLPTAQFNELCFALNPPKGVLSPSNAPQGERTKTLLDWAEGPTGPGLMAVDQGLQVLVPKITQPEQSPKPKAFAVSGKMGDLSPEELEAIVQLLRQKTGDDSIDLALFTEGSIKLVLNGSPEGLDKLQELFDSGELTNVLEGRSVEYVHSIESDTTEARKVRLLQVLRFCTQKNEFNRPQKLARKLEQDLDRNRIQAEELDRELDLSRVLDTAQELELALERIGDTNQNSGQYIAPIRARARKLNSDLHLALELALGRTKAFGLGRDIDQDLEIARALSRDLAQIKDVAGTLVRDLGQDLDSNINLGNMNLKGANLRELDLREINLKGANLTDADVTRMLFGNNPGLTEADKRNLQQRSAILQDPPSSDVTNLVRR